MSVRMTLIRLLERLLPLPTTSFHEGFVSSFICEELKNSGFDPQLDRYGNIKVRWGAEESRVAWVAHMDHPGFEIIEASGNRAEAQWFGGVDPKYFMGARVVIYQQSSGVVSAKGWVEDIAKNSQGRVDKMTLRVEGNVDKGDFGTWDLVPYRRRGELIYTKGADDLVGCAVMIAALNEIKQRGLKKGVLAIFTRAEEIGFIGTLGVLEHGCISPTTRMISIETSKALPGVRLGSGPVIRLGDRTSMFHHQMVLFMDHVAREEQKKDRDFSYQRRVMDGGTCEATPFQLKGYVAGGMAIPLRNYHNQGGKVIAPEGVHLRDVEGSVRLLVQTLRRIDEFEVPVDKIRRRWDGAWQKYHGRLEGREKAN